MHRVLLRTISIDVPSAVHDGTVAFWATALGARPRRGVKYPEYHVLEEAGALSPVMTQDIGTTPARYHLDIESDDVDAEVARLVAAGAQEVERHSDWVVLRDPAGLPFCIVPAEAPDFAERSVQVGH